MTDQTTDLEVRDPHLPEQTIDRPLITDREINRLYRVGKALAASRMFKDASSAEQAFAKILLGRDLGMSPTESMTSIDLIEGKPEVNANWQAGKIRRTPGYDFKVITLTNEACEVEFFVQGESVGVSSFTIEDAERADLPKRARGSKSKGNYDKYPRNMLWARAMSNGVHFFIPEIMHGIRVYSPGEIETLGPDPREQAAGPQEIPQGVPMRDEVVRIVGLAREHGHAGLSDVPTIAMLLDGQPVEYVQQWVERARGEIDAVVGQEPAEAEVVPDDLIPEDGEPVPDGVREQVQETLDGEA